MSQIAIDIVTYAVNVLLIQHVRRALRQVDDGNVVAGGTVSVEPRNRVTYQKHLENRVKQDGNDNHKRCNTCRRCSFNE